MFGFYRTATDWNKLQSCLFGCQRRDRYYAILQVRILWEYVQSCFYGLDLNKPTTLYVIAKAMAIDATDIGTHTGIEDSIASRNSDTLIKAPCVARS